MDIRELQQAAQDFVRHSPLNTVRAIDALREDLAGLTLFEDPLLAVGAADDALFESLRDEAVVHPDTWPPRQWLKNASNVLSCFLPFTPEVRRPNWSERHAAYICGLGTFGLCKGIITRKGMAGRLVSIVTTCPLPPTPRPYADIYEYCSRCGLCARRCPAQAIDPARGMHQAKDHAPCNDFLEKIRALPPRGASARMRYGCGKCQTGVPCEKGIPPRLQGEE